MKEGLTYNQDNPIAKITLKGEPYQRTVDGLSGPEEVDCNITLTDLANNSGYVEGIGQTVADNEPSLRELLDGDGFYGIDRKLKHGGELTFDDAFSLAAFVCSGLNKPLDAELNERINNLGPHETHLLQATALLSAMSAKEGYVGLNPEEIAGVVAATIELDTVVRTPVAEPILSFGGMGGDRGYPLNGTNSKLFSLSTLSAVGLSADGLVHKHHSYPNTSKLAGQSAIEAFGARSDFHTPEAFERVIEESGVMMSSCHDTRTLHTLSHRLRGETINHAIGPLSFTLAKDASVQAFIGVNEKIHPQTIIDALRLIQDRGYQRYGNSAVYCGTDLEAIPAGMLVPTEYVHDTRLKAHVAIDEVAPPPYVTVASFLVNGENAGSYALTPEDFYTPDVLNDIPFKDLLVPNDPVQIMEQNRRVLAGEDEAKMRYLAMTMGLGLFVRHAVGREDALEPQTHRVNRDYLRECTDFAYELIKTGKAADQMDRYVASTQRHAGNNNHGV